MATSSDFPATITASRTLTAYAFLSHATHGQADLLGGLAPLFRPIAKANAGKRFNPTEFAAAVANLYGFKMHPWALEDFAPRLAEAGVLTRVSTSSVTHDYLYASISEEFTQLSERDIAAVIGRFIGYARPLLEEAKVSATDEELERVLLAALTKLEFIEVLLRPEKSASFSGRNVLGLGRAASSFPADLAQENRARLEVLCAGFILHAYRTDRSTYDLLSQVVSGALITEVVLEFQSPSLPGNLDQLTVILDSPFLMSFLDLTTAEAHAFAKDLVGQLKEHGARVATFRHCMDEIRDNLKAVISATKGGLGHGATARRLYTPAFLTYANAVHNDPETRLSTAGIGVVELMATERWFRNFTQQDEEEIGDVLGNYDNPLARERDAASVAAVMRFRAGARARMGRFDTAKYLFVTENPRLVRAATRLLAKKQLYREGEVPPAITDRYLAGLLWALYGGKAMELAPKLLLANCAAALEPRSDMVAKMHRFISELDPERVEYFTALMTTERASQHLMELTLGDSDFLTRDNAPAVLERLAATLIEREKATALKEREALEASHSKAVATLESARQETADNLRETETQRMAVEAERDRLASEKTALRELLKQSSVIAQEQTRLRLQRIAGKARRGQRTTYFAIGGIATILIVGAGIIASMNLAPQWTALAWLVTAVLAFLGFWKIPDLLFSRWITKRTDKSYTDGCQLENLNSTDDRFIVDLSAGTVKSLDSLPVDAIGSNSIDS